MQHYTQSQSTTDAIQSMIGNTAADPESTREALQELQVLIDAQIAALNAEKED